MTTFSLISFILISVSFHLNSFASSFEVIDRDSAMKLIKIKANQEELGIDGSNAFKNFNFSKSTEESFRDINEIPHEDTLRVFTLAYHLNKARNYFINNLNSDHVRNLDEITVRYNMARGFSTGRHFTKDDREYNNAVTNKASNQYILSSEGVKPWGIEIWFRPAREEKARMPKLSQAQNTEVSEELLNLADSAVYDLTKQSSIGISNPSLDSTHYYAQLGLILFIKKVFPYAFDTVMPLLPLKMSLDSAMIPEIIYHEFAHVALSDSIPLTGSFPVSEAMANYFAAVISGNKTIAGKLGDFGNNINPVTPKANVKYRSEYETNENLAHHSFTYCYLWSIRQRLKDEITYKEIPGDILFDRIVFQSRIYLDLSSDHSITKSLPASLIKSVSSHVSDKNIAKTIRLIISQEAKNGGM